MKTNEEYLEDYFYKQNNLSKKGELWRLRVTEHEFISKIEEIREWGKKARQSNYLNKYHIQRNEEAQVSVMLMDKLTIEECKEQVRILKQESINYHNRR